MTPRMPASEKKGYRLPRTIVAKTLRREWALLAECSDADPELFFETGSKTCRQICRDMCEICPVRSNCLADALEWEETGGGRHGIFGGMVPQERRALAKERRRSS